MTCQKNDVLQVAQQDVSKYRYIPLNHMGNIVMRMETINDNDSASLNISSSVYISPDYFSRLK